MKFLSSEARQRTRFLEKTRSSVIETLGSKEVKQHLGEYALQLLAIAEGLYVPNIKNRAVITPKKYQGTDNIPMIAINHGEGYWRDSGSAAMTPTQKARAISFLAEWAKKSMDNAVSPPVYPISQHLDKTDSVLQGAAMDKFSYPAGDISFVNPHALGTVCSLMVRGDLNVHTPEKTYVNSSIYVGQPIVALMAKKSLSEPARNELLVHELTHVNQWQLDPVRSPIAPGESYDMLPYELEAYHVEDRYMKATGYQKDIPKPTDIVERIRLEHATPDNAFYVRDSKVRGVLSRLVGIA